MVDPRQTVGCENDEVRSVDPLCALVLAESIEKTQLEWRRPYWLYASLVWSLAGPINPAGFLAYFLFSFSLQTTIVLIAMPSSLGIALAIWRLPRQRIYFLDVMGSITLWAALTIPIYTALLVAFALGAQGLEESLLLMALKGLSGLFIGLGLGITFGWVAVYLAIPAAIAAISIIRLCGLKRTGPVKSATDYTP